MPLLHPHGLGSGANVGGGIIVLQNACGGGGGANNGFGCITVVPHKHGAALA